MGKSMGTGAQSLHKNKPQNPCFLPNKPATTIKKGGENQKCHSFIKNKQSSSSTVQLKMLKNAQNTHKKELFVLLRENM